MRNLYAAKTVNELKLAYRRGAGKIHPDTNGISVKRYAQKAFIRLKNLYEKKGRKGFP